MMIAAPHLAARSATCCGGAARDTVARVTTATAASGINSSTMPCRSLLAEIPKTREKPVRSVLLTHVRQGEIDALPVLARQGMTILAHRANSIWVVVAKSSLAGIPPGFVGDC